MYFRHKNLYDFIMAFTIESADQKQHLNLSDDAWAEIDDDRRNFSATPDLIPLATFLNKVISNFYESADASIDFQTSKYKHELEQEIDASFLKKRYSQATEQDYIAFLVNKKIDALVQKSQSYEKGFGRKFRLSNENVELLEDSKESRYYDEGIGKYLKALLEEYAKKQYSERELIYFKDIKQTIDQAILAGSRLKIALSNGDKRTISPYGVVIEKAGSFHYLVGYVYLDRGARSGLAPVTFRLSRIISIRQITSASGHISKEKREEIEQLIHEKGAQFLTGESEQIVVRLSSEGIKKLNSIVRGRPILVSNEKDVYTFAGSIEQAFIYFYRFGADAVIISPQKLHDRVIKTLSETINAYQK